MKTLAKEISTASETTQVTMVLVSMWAVCALLLILE
jgi:hypothetical protein